MTTNATNQTTITAYLPDFASDTIDLRLLSSVAISGTEIFPGKIYTMALDADGVGSLVIPTPDGTGDLAWLWEVNLPDGREQNVSIAWSSLSQDLATILATAVSTTTPSDIAQLITNKVNRDGDTMTGDLTLSGAPTSDLHAATKKYVDDSAGGAGAFAIQRANHTGTQTLSTISDAGTMAAEDAGDYAGRGRTPVYIDAKMICHFDGAEPYETDFSGSALGHTGQVPTITEAGVYRPGRFGKALQVAVATVNYAQNPVFSGSLSPVKARGTFTKSTERYTVGAEAVKIVVDDGVDNAYYLPLQEIVPLAPGETVTISCWVYNVDAPSIRIRRNKPSYSNVATVSETGKWVYMSGRYTATESVTGLQLFFYVDGANSTAYFDEIQIEKSSYVSPFFYGDMPGHTWSGTPHASTSSRPASQIKYANTLNVSADTVMMHWQPAAGYDSQPTSYLFDEGNLAAYFDSTDYKIYFTDGTNTISTAVLDFPAKDWIHLAFTYGAGLAIYLNGEAATGATYTAPALGDWLWIGSDSAGANQANGWIDELVIAGSELDADLITTIYESNAPISSPSAIFQPVIFPMVTETAAHTGDATYTEIPDQASRITMAAAWDTGGQYQFEATIKATSTYTAYAQLMRHNSGSPVQIAEVSATSTTANRVRSVPFYLPAAEDEYYVEIKISDAAGTVTITRANLLLLPGGGSTTL